MRTNAHVMPTSMKHIEELVANIRPEDKREIEGLSGATPLSALTWGYKHSRFCRTIIAEDEVAGVFGVCDTGVSAIGAPWLSATPLLPTIALRFLKESRMWVNNMRASGDYTKLINIIDTRNSLHVKWIKWLGAKLYGDPIKTHYKRFEL